MRRGAAMRSMQVLGLVLVGWMAALPIGAAAADEEPRVALTGHLVDPKAMAEATHFERSSKVAEAQSLTLTIVLRRTDEAGFARFLDEIYDRQSPNFRRFATPEAVTDRFG